MIPEEHWHHLAALEPEAVCRRSGARYDPTRGCYTLPLLDRQVQVDPGARSVVWLGESQQVEREASRDVALLVVVYLIGAREMPPSGDWVTSESLPAGAFFFRGLHAISTEGVAARFGHDMGGFLRAGERLGGGPVEAGDACVQVQVLPRIATRLLLWMGDDEFPAQVTMLFDSRVHEHVPLDVLHIAARHTTRALVLAASNP